MESCSRGAHVEAGIGHGDMGAQFKYSLILLTLERLNDFWNTLLFH